MPSHRLVKRVYYVLKAEQRIFNNQFKKISNMQLQTGP